MDRSEQQSRTRLGSRVDQALSRFHRTAHELGLQHEVLGRIAGQLKLRHHQQVGSGRLFAHGEDCLRIAVEVADALVHLGEGDRQTVRHAGDLAREPLPATFTEL